MKMNWKSNCFLIFIQFLHSIRFISTTSNRDSGCDPVVDILFVLDTSYEVSRSEITTQINFIRSLLREHTAPSGAVRVAIMTCGDRGVSASQFTSSYISLLNNYGQNYYATRRYKNRHCLQNVNFKFKTEARAAASRIAIILRWSWRWEEGAARRQSELARKENTVLVVVAIGTKDFGSLSALQSVAYSKATFFVVSNSSDLQSLAKDLSKGTCRPISLDLRSETNILPQTTKAPATVHEPCIQLSGRMFKRYVPGFGYTRQRCPVDQTLDFDLCRCV